MKYFFAGMRGGLAAACLVLMLLMLLAGPGARAQAPAWQSAVAINNGSATGSSTEAMTTDAAGNVYIVGDFAGTIRFGTASFSSMGGKDVFVAKYSATGSLLWAQQASGPGTEHASSVAVSGNKVYVAGYFDGGTASFGGITLANSANAGQQEVFIAKLTDTGGAAAFTWGQQAGGAGGDEATALALSGSSVYVAGSFGRSGLTATFGSTVLSKLYYNSENIFVAKLTDAGATSSFVWAQRAGGTSGDGALAMAVSSAGVFVGGYFASPTASFGSLMLANTNLSPNNTQDAFIAKLTDAGATGSFVWVQRAGGTDRDGVLGMAVTDANVYVTGIFNSAVATFGSTSLINASPSNNTPFNTNDVFVAKLTDTGSTASFAWALRAGSANADYAAALAVRGASVYVGGSFAGQVAFGGTTLSSTTASASDLFVAKILDVGPGGSFAWAQQAGGPGDDQASALALGSTSVLVAGSIEAAATFGSLSISSPSPGSAGFLAALSDPTLTATTPALAGAAFTLAPNPARASTTVTLPALPGAATATLLLRDALGRTIRTATVALPPAGLRHELSLAGLAPGLYALQVRAGEATATRRLVVE